MLTVLSSHVTSVASRKKNLPAEKKPPIHRPPGGHPTTTSGRSGHAVTRWEAGDGGDGWKQDPKENSNLSGLFSFFFFQLVECISGRKSHRGDSRPHQVPPRGLLEKKQQNSPHPWRMRNVTPASLFFLHTHTHTPTRQQHRQQQQQHRLRIKRSNKTLTFHRKKLRLDLRQKFHQVPPGGLD